MVDIRENCYERQERSSDKLIDMVTQSNVLASLENECESQGLAFVPVAQGLLSPHKVSTSRCGQLAFFLVGCSPLPT